MTDDYIISKEDFDSFAHQMTVTFPFMPKIVREEWMARIDRVRSSSLSLVIKTEKGKLLDELKTFGMSFNDHLYYEELLEKIKTMRSNL
jgi:hypothetical protein